MLHVFAEGIGVLTRYNDATAINNTILLTPTTISNVAYGFNRYYSTSPAIQQWIQSDQWVRRSRICTRLRESVAVGNFFLPISPSGVASLGSANSGPTINYSRNFVIGLSKTLGKHNIKKPDMFTGAVSAFTPKASLAATGRTASTDNTLL